MVKIDDMPRDICWRCGKNTSLTQHHSIPKTLKPIYNIEIPVCRECHMDINLNYFNGGSNLIKSLKYELRVTENWNNRLTIKNGKLENKVLFLKYKIKEREKEIQKLKKKNQS